MRFLVTSLVLVAALGGTAANAEEPEPAPASTAVGAVRPEASPSRRRPPRPAESGTRLIAESLTGMFLNLGAAIGGGALGYFSSDPSLSSLTLGVSLGAASGSALGSWAGVMIAGQICRGRGNPLATAFGALGGGAVTLAVLLGVLGNNDPSNTPLIDLAAGVVLFVPTTGAILGYELSRPESPDSTTAPPVQLTPTFSLAPDGRGGRIGLAGTF